MMLKVTGIGGKAPENIRELGHFALDRGLGLNVSPRIFIAEKVDGSVWKDVASSDRRDALKDAFEDGQGHLMEFINSDPAITTLDNVDDKDVIETYSTPEKRKSWYGMALLDAITGNPDRHSSNLMHHPELGVVPIDSGLGFEGFSHGNQIMSGNNHFGDRWLPGRRRMGGGGDEADRMLGGAFRRHNIIDRDAAEKELNDFFY